MDFPDLDLTRLNTLLLTLAACFSAYAAWRQTQINKRLKDLGDFAAVVAVPDTNVIKIHNAGKINLYLRAYKYGNDMHVYSEGRLLTVGTGEAAFYWLPLPSQNHFSNGKLSLELFLEDQFGVKYTASFGGELLTAGLAIWSHKTVRKDWKF